MSDFLPFPEDLEMDGSQKYYTSGLYNYNILGIPNGYSGVDRRNQLMWNKRGVALAYLLVPTLKSAVDVISTNLASVPMVLKDENGNIIHRSDMSGSANDKFLYAIEKSYKYYGVPVFELWAKSLLLYGENVLEKVPTTYGNDIVGLKWLNPLAIQIDLTVEEDNGSELFNGGKSRFYEARKFYYTGKYETITYDENEVLYSRAFNPIDDIRGYSDALSAISKANITIEFENFTLAFYANSGHPGVIISPRDRLAGEKNVKEWQREWQEKFRGSYNQFKTHISGFPFDVHSFDVLDISQPLEVSKDAETKILRSLRVPPEMIGDTSENSYQFSKESKNAFMQTVVRPLALSISNCINHSNIIQEFNGVDNNLRFGFDFSEYENVAKTDLDKQDVLERKVKSGGISIGAYQRAIGAKVVEGSDDTFMLPQGFVFVKKDALVKPDTIPQQEDKTGAEPNSMNQQERRTQSETGEEESRDFFASKNAQIEGFKRFSDESDTNTHDDDIFASYGMIPLKYSHINFNLPDEIVESIKSYVLENETSDGIDEFRNFSIKEYQVTPKDVKNINKALNSNNEIKYKVFGGERALEWSNKIIEQMKQADKNEKDKIENINRFNKMVEKDDLSFDEILEFIQQIETLDKPNENVEQ